MSVATDVPKSFLRRFGGHWIGCASALFLLVLIVACAAAPLLAPYSPTETDLHAVLSGPSSQHLLGTDELGRDVVSRLLYGGRGSLVGVGEVVCVAVLLGLPLGLLAGFRRGFVDATLSRASDLGLAIPFIVVLLMVYAVFGDNQTAVMVAFGVLLAPSLFRVVRSTALQAREELHVTAAKVSGLGPIRVVTRHIFPRTVGPLVVNCSVIAAVALVVQTGLTYLGLGVQPPAPSWGGMVAEAQSAIQLQAWLLVPTGGIIAVTVIALVLLGDALRDTFAERWTRPTTALVRSSDLSRHWAQSRETVGSEVAEPERASLCRLRDVCAVISGPSGDIPLLDRISFDIAPGEALGLVGESGCGKTMTALCILGLLPHAVSVISGEGLFRGKSLFALSPAERAAIRGTEIAFVSQEPMASLDPSFTVGSQLSEFVRKHHGVSRAAARSRTLELLDSVRISDPRQVARSYAHQLSGGMAQRVCIAAAIAGEPSLLVADEPTTALDVTVQAEILDLLRALQKDRDMAILLVTHDWGAVSDFCTRAVVLYAGQVVEESPVAELVRYPEHPYSAALLAASPERAVQGQRLVTVPGSVPHPEEWAATTGCRFAPRCQLSTDECTQQSIPLLSPSFDRSTRCIHHERISRDPVGSSL